MLTSWEGPRSPPQERLKIRMGESFLENLAFSTENFVQFLVLYHFSIKMVDEKGHPEKVCCLNFWKKGCWLIFSNESFWFLLLRKWCMRVSGKKMKLSLVVDFLRSFFGFYFLQILLLLQLHVIWEVFWYVLQL